MSTTIITATATDIMSTLLIIVAIIVVPVLLIIFVGRLKSTDLKIDPGNGENEELGESPNYSNIDEEFCDGLLTDEEKFRFKNYFDTQFPDIKLCEKRYKQPIWFDNFIPVKIGERRTLHCIFEQINNDSRITRKEHIMALQLKFRKLVKHKAIIGVVKNEKEQSVVTEINNCIVIFFVSRYATKHTILVKTDSEI